eukprot:tig00020510_g9853.t1
MSAFSFAPTACPSRQAISVRPVAISTRPQFAGESIPSRRQIVRREFTFSPVASAEPETSTREFTLANAFSSVSRAFQSLSKQERREVVETVKEIEQAEESDAHSDAAHTAQHRLLALLGLAFDYAMLPESPAGADEMMPFLEPLHGAGSALIAANLVTTTFNNFLQIYLFLLTIRVVLTWLPNLEETQPVAILRSITDPYLNLFRNLIPPIGGIDISPILAFLLLQFLQTLFPQ